MDKYLFICGVLPSDENVEKNTKNFIQFAAENYQRNIISGFKKNKINLISISTPFIGSYPLNYKKIFFKAKKKVNDIVYLSFNNIWGLRNFSRYKSLKRYVVNNIKPNENLKVIIYSPHTPFVKLSKLFKRKYPSIEICLIVPDLPQYMNLKEKKTLIYRFFKKIDIYLFNKYISFVDKFVFLTKDMNEVVNKYNKEYIVIEGIASDNQNIFKPNGRTKSNKIIVYTGLINERFGIEKLINAFKAIPSVDIELHFYGTGDFVEYVVEQSKSNNRIKYFGIVNRSFSTEVQINADVLVNPRFGNSEYLKFSFPSKIIEYLNSGNPVVSYKLEGIPEEYDDVLFYPLDESVEQLSKTLMNLCYLNNKERKVLFERQRKFLRSKNDQNATLKILKLIKGENW